MLKKCISFAILLFATANIALCNDFNTIQFKYQTIYNRKINFQWISSNEPNFIRVDDSIVFQTVKNRFDKFESFRWAGETFPKGNEAPGSTQYGFMGGFKKCLRWVIVVESDVNRHYIIDFTTKSPTVIGPFGQDDESQGNIKRIIWGKHFATIEFASTNKYYYEYKTQKIYFQEEP